MLEVIQVMAYAFIVSVDSPKESESHVAIIDTSKASRSSVGFEDINLKMSDGRVENHKGQTSAKVDVISDLCKTT